jgi:hypothetical protein
MWPFTNKKLQAALAMANETNQQSVKNVAVLEELIATYQSMFQQQDDLIGRLQSENEVERMRLVACGVGAMANTPESAKQQRVDVESPYFCASVGDVYAAVDREMKLREELEVANDRAFRASEAHVVTMGKFQAALDIIGKVVKTKLQGDMRDNAQEAEKFYNLHRGTKVCVMCGSEMIPLHSEDKKICSNGACGHEVEWKLEEGQKYQHKNNVEPFVEDRSAPEEPRSQTRF